MASDEDNVSLWAQIGLIMLVLGLFALGCYDKATATKTSAGTGMVISREYVPCSTQFGTGIDPNTGNVISTQSSSPERWLVMVRIADQIEVIDIKPDLWAAIEPDHEVDVFEWRGMFGTWSKSIELR